MPLLVPYSNEKGYSMRKLKRLIVTTLFVFSGCATIHAQTQLFTVPEAIADADAESLLEPTRFVRGAVLDIDTAALLAATEETEFLITALDVKDARASLVPLESPSAESKAWHGTFEGGEITLVLRQGASIAGNEIVRQSIAAGTIRTDNGDVYQIRQADGTRVIVRQFDVENLPEEPEGILPDEEMPRAIEADADAAKDIAYEFTVAVFYTKKAKDAAGGTSKINAVIDLAVTETNVAYSASKIKAKLKLVHKTQTTDSESGGFDGMLKRLQKTSDGHMDEVHTKRNTYKADLVVLICEDDSYCGLAYRMKTESSSFSKWAFSVVNRNCATGYYSFAHELGHNMGCCHDAAHPCTSQIYPYAYGWHFKKGATEYRTIMAYAPGKRIQRFSNPNVKYLGVATGKAGAAENYKTINNTANTVAAFR